MQSRQSCPLLNHTFSNALRYADEAQAVSQLLDAALQTDTSYLELETDVLLDLLHDGNMARVFWF